MNILILYASTEGHSRKLALFMQIQIRSFGNDVTVCDVASTPPPPKDFDKVVIGGSLHVLKHRVLLASYIHRHAMELNRRPSAFFSVSLGIATGKGTAIREARNMAGAFLSGTGWEPDLVELVAGGLTGADHDFFKLMVMKKLGGGEPVISGNFFEHVYTDHKRLTEFCKIICSMPERSWEKVPVAGSNLPPGERKSRAMQRPGARRPRIISGDLRRVQYGNDDAIRPNSAMPGTSLS